MVNCMLIMYYNRFENLHAYVIISMGYNSKSDVIIEIGYGRTW